MNIQVQERVGGHQNSSGQVGLLPVRTREYIIGQHIPLTWYVFFSHLQAALLFIPCARVGKHATVFRKAADQYVARSALGEPAGVAGPRLRKSTEALLAKEEDARR